MATSAKKRLLAARNGDIVSITLQEAVDETLAGSDIPPGASVLVTIESKPGRAIPVFLGYLRPSTRGDLEAMVYYTRPGHLDERALEYIARLGDLISERAEAQSDVQLVYLGAYPRGSNDGLCLYRRHLRVRGLREAVHEVVILDALLHQAAANAILMDASRKD